jgi:uncharacterized protein (DUF1501 family)
MIDRREFLKLSGLTAAVSLPVTRLALADTPGEARYVLVILRGGMDGLAAVPAYSDNNYRKLRGTLALPDPGQEQGILDIDGYFGLHPAFKNLHTLFSEGDALIFHNVASPYRERSHFDGQKLLENGTPTPLGADDGWLNRALGELPSQDMRSAIAMAQNVPLVLYGEHPVNSWAPAVLPEVRDDAMTRIMRMYKDDEFLLTQLKSAIETRAMAGEVSMSEERQERRGRGQVMAYINATANFLAEPDGARIAVLELSGWDTHANQGAGNGQLANQFQALDEGLISLKNTLGSFWKNTVITIVTEFGRTAAVNGSNGTDHGTASVAFVIGGAVNGGRLITDWPGLSANDLYDGRDLKPTVDMRSLFKSVLHDHLEVSRTSLENKIFPDSSHARFIPDLIQA